MLEVRDLYFGERDPLHELKGNGNRTAIRDGIEAVSLPERLDWLREDDAAAWRGAGKEYRFRPCGPTHGAFHRPFSPAGTSIVEAAQLHHIRPGKGLFSSPFMMNFKQIEIDKAAPWDQYFYHPDCQLTQEASVRAMQSEQASFRAIWHKDLDWIEPVAEYQGCLFRLHDSFHSFFISADCNPENLILLNVLKNWRLHFLWSCMLDRLTSSETGFLYCIRCNEFYKIGITDDFERRYTKYVTENPYDLQVLFSERLAGHRRIEERIKMTFEPKRKRGEWFKFDFQDLKLIHRIADNLRFTPHVVLRPDRNLVRIEDLPF